MNNIEKIRKKLGEKYLDAVIIENEKNQRYAAGFPFTDGSVIVAREGAWLITDSRYIEAAGMQAEGVEILMYEKQKPLRAFISEIISSSAVKRLGIEEKSLSYGRYLELKELLPCELVPAQYIFSDFRASKSEEEIGYMKEAQAISEAALDEVLGIIKPGMTEKEIAAELVYRMLRHGSEGNSFDPIVVTGTKTSMPHGVPGDNIVKAGDFLTMDFGCIKHGYCSDMTRTVAVGHASDEMRKIYSIVLEAQLAGIAASAAGVPGCEIDAAARKVISDAGYGAYFGHGYGHSLGLDIHEAPNANPTGTAPMPVGAVVSAEPGIYLPGKFGVRIEDVAVMREGGCEVITKAPKQLIIL
ncbi:MAG: aminopeptidase P family protein [Oscillospiraceae bacterium]|nr:aminopeptidase P family protein [Oscillospiraceae bacterium]